MDPHRRSHVHPPRQIWQTSPTSVRVYPADTTSRCDPLPREWAGRLVYISAEGGAVDWFIADHAGAEVSTTVAASAAGTADATLGARLFERGQDSFVVPHGTATQYLVRRTASGAATVRLRAADEAPRKAPIVWEPSLAASMWGADFELHADECPRGVGRWRDRAGGRVAICHGEGDWIERDGCVGVSRSDTCYVELPSSWHMLFAPKDTGLSTVRTIAVIFRCSAASGNVPFAGFPYLDATATARWRTATFATISGRHALNLRPTLTTGGSRCDPVTARGVERLVCGLWVSCGDAPVDQYRAGDPATLAWSTVTDDAPAGVANDGAGDLFRAHNAGHITDADSRDLVIKTIATGPGVANLTQIRAWAQAMGVNW